MGAEKIREGVRLLRSLEITIFVIPERLYRESISAFKSIKNLFLRL